MGRTGDTLDTAGVTHRSLLVRHSLMDATRHVGRTGDTLDTAGVTVTVGRVACACACVDSERTVQTVNGCQCAHWTS